MALDAKIYAQIYAQIEAQIEAAKAAGKNAAESGPSRAAQDLQIIAQIQATKDAAEKADAADKDKRAAAAIVFWFVFGLISLLLVLMFVVVARSLVKGKWSLREALSEESSVQPNKDEVKLLASTSRFIALFGLLGILTIVLGVGYTIIWNLLLYQKPPDLSEVRSFLYGAACLFAPYLANQLRATFEKSPDKTGADPKSSDKPAADNQDKKGADADADKA